MQHGYGVLVAQLVKAPVKGTHGPESSRQVEA
jgi:hypothetical protein